MNIRRKTLGTALSAMILVACSVVAVPSPSAAIDEGSPAPDFRLPASTGLDVSLGDFKGKKWVFLEFYGSDFAPV